MKPLALLVAVALAAVPRTHATPYAVHVKVAYRGMTLERCAVDLVVDGAAAGHAVTPESGEAEFEGLSSERFELLVKRDGYFPRRVIVYNFARRDISEDIELKKRVHWSLAGTVRGPAGLLPQAVVKLTEGADQPAQAVVAADGTFAFPDLYDTECAFAVEKPGYHRQLVWMANREQRDLAVDVVLRPAKEAAGAPWVRGEPEPDVELRFERARTERFRAGPALTALADCQRIAPADEGPPGALTGVRITMGGGARPAGALARVDRLLASRMLAYPARRVRKRR